ncbi:MAG: hypothetical protein LQ351_007707 [Letrouitia transgressa]|nr:MAG: hypothetical protein LQ351_007707 [Letrouitia transgressa]
MPQSIDGNATDGSELDESNDPTAPLLKSQSSYHTRIVEKIASLLSNWHIAFLGAALVILINLFDPFLQQVVTYPNRQIPSDEIPIIVRSRIYEARSYEGLPLPSVVDLSMKAAIYSGIFSIQDKADRDVEHTCSTAFSLPDGPTLSGPGNHINVTTTNISAIFHDIQPSIIRFSSLESNDRTDGSSRQVATECIMYYCIQNIVASVIDGFMRQNILSSWRNDSATPGSASDLILKPPVSFTNQTGEDSTTLFKVTQLAATAMKSFMSDTFKGSGGFNDSEPTFFSDVIQALYKTNNLTTLIDNLAHSMSNNIRQQNDTTPNVNGTAWRTETFVQVRWAWLSFPAILVLASLFFLVISVWDTAHRDVLVWKASCLALLFQGRTLDLTGCDNDPVNQLSEMNNVAAKINVQLETTVGGDWRFTIGE